MQTLSSLYLGAPSLKLRDTLHGLSAPLRSVVSFFAPWTQGAPPENSPTVQAAPLGSLAAEASRRPSHPKVPQSRPRPSQQAANANSFTAPRLVKPVRALRVVDGSCTAQSAGRMKIVGRFSDVCAELDRMCRDEVAA